MTSVLFVVTGSDHWTLADGTRHPTGYWAEELAEPHRLFSESGYDITIATPGGVTPTADLNSFAPQFTGGQERSDQLAAYLESIADLDAPEKVEEVDAEAYDIIFYPGGHGPMEDLSADSASGALLTRALDSGTALGVLCHAPAALLAARRADGSWPFAGYRLTGFSNAEETMGGLADKAKWLLEDRLVQLGAEYSAADPFTAYTVTDRNLHTGQNPASSVRLAGELIAAVGR